MRAGQGTCCGQARVSQLDGPLPPVSLTCISEFSLRVSSCVWARLRAVRHVAAASILASPARASTCTSGLAIAARASVSAWATSPWARSGSPAREAATARPARARPWTSERVMVRASLSPFEIAGLRDSCRQPSEDVTPQVGPGDEASGRGGRPYPAPGRRRQPPKLNRPAHLSPQLRRVALGRVVGRIHVPNV
jgi:hypothetical protein